MHCIRKKNIWTWSTEMSRNYRCVRFVNFSMSSLGVFSDECSTLLDMMNDIGIDKKQQLYIINWDGPDLMQLWFLSFFFLFGFCFVLFLFLFVFFFFIIIQSQAAFVNCLYVARFTIVHSKTQMKFPFLLLFVVLPDCLSVVVVLCLQNYGTSRHCKYTCTLYVNSFYFLFFVVVVVVFSED